jgi:phosphatidate cytidylyltransferase
MTRELAWRLTLGPVLAGAIALLLVWDFRSGARWGVFLASVGAVLLGAHEFRRLAQVRAANARLAPLVMTVLALIAEGHLHPGGVLAPWLHVPEAVPLAPIIIGAGLLWTVLGQMARHATEDFFANVGATLFGIVYLGVAFNLLQRLALAGDAVWAERGLALLLLLLVAVKCGDITAFFGGRWFGWHKMSPRISPGKTWEGFAASFVGAIGGTFLATWLIASATGHAPFAHAWQTLLWGLLLGPLGVVGDLAESAMKRDAAVKDSGRLIPGFGGFLDLADAVVLAVPVAYVLALLLR